MRVKSTTTSPADFARGTEALLARAVTAGVDEVTTGLKTAIREDILASGLPRKIANIVRSQRYPRRGDAIDAAGVVLERRNKPNRDTANLVSVFNTGPAIYVRNRRWLAIPTAAVEQGHYPEFGARRHRVTPAIFEAVNPDLTLRFVAVSSRLALLVADFAKTTKKGRVRKAGPKDRQRPVVCFVLVPSVKLRKRLDWEARSREALAALPAAIVRHFS